MTKQLQSETLQFNLYKMYKMTTKTRSEIMTKKTRSEIGREASAYFAPNWHLCQNYTESGSFLTIHKNIKASIHKNAQDSTIVECNFYDTNAIVTDWLQVLSNPLRLFRGLNDCKHYLLHPRQATFYTYTKGNK
jgi:hypothetical protein